MAKAIYITRSDLSGWTDNTTFVQAPLSVARTDDLTLYVRKGTGVPEILRERCKTAEFNKLMRLIHDIPVDARMRVCTPFDFPCMWIAWRLKRKMGCQWTMFLWDPPALSHRDKFPPLRWAIDLVFRWFARRCDHLVLNIHPGLLGEIGFSSEEIERWSECGKLELRMQDAFNGLVPQPLSTTSIFDYDVGILSNETVAKGKDLVAAAMRRLPGMTCKWFHGMRQSEAFDALKRCRVLLVPYLPVGSLKWNYTIKIFEYLQLGRPIIASDNPGNAEVARRFPGRIDLFRSGDASDLAAKLREMLQ